MSKGLQEFSMLALLGARKEAEEIGWSQIKSLVCHAKEYFLKQYRATKSFNQTKSDLWLYISLCKQLWLINFCVI